MKWQNVFWKGNAYFFQEGHAENFFSNLGRGHFLTQVLRQFIQKFEGVEVITSLNISHRPLDANGQIFRHESSLDGFDTYIFKSLAKFSEPLVAVQFSTMAQPTGPSKDTCDWICTGFFALEMISVGDNHKPIEVSRDSLLTF